MNTNLQTAKRSKNDEFYTQYSDIEKELQNYDVSIFKDKVVYLPADVASFDATIPQSEFVRYFLTNAESLGYKRLIATCLEKFTPNGLNGYEYNNTDDDSVRERNFKCLPDPDGSYGSGDFRSKECTEILKKSDIIVTNPPFSLFREFIAWLKQGDGTLKPCIIIGNQNAITYKEVFPLIRDNKLWTGSQKGCVSMFFETPSDYIASEEAKNYCIKKLGTDFCSEHSMTYMRNFCWFTNQPNKRLEDTILLVERFYDEDGVTPLSESKVKYPKYNNYDAIDVSKLSLIPKDYYGVMGVPITFLYQYNPDQFKIVGMAEDNGKGYSGIESNWDGLNPHCVVNGKNMYKRIFIKRVNSHQTIRRKLNQ